MTYAIILLAIAVLILDAVLLSIFRGADKARESERAFQERYHKLFLEQRKVQAKHLKIIYHCLGQIAQALTKKEAE